MFRSAVWLSILLPLCGLARGAQVCSLAFERCPGEFASGSLTVPRDIVWLDARIPACSGNIRIQSPGGAPSIVFVIDNSGSMSKGDEDKSSGGNDPDEARLRVVKDMLDTIARSAPSAEVGLVLFTRRLQFDDRDNPFFRRAFADTAQHDAFAPLTPLDKNFGAGVTGLDTLKALLKYTGNGNLVYATKYPDGRASSHYDPPSIRDGTDISLGFEAAKAALRDARAAKQDQFIIFLSDGEPSDVDDSREALKNEFQKGRDVPTTFTVFFKGDTENPKVPKTIQTMTDSIRANGYSETNPKSAYWAINQPGVQLDTLLRNRVLNPIIIDAAGKAERAVLTVGGIAYRSASADADGFRFEKRVALTGEETRIDLAYTYAYVDSGVAKTKEIPYTLTVRRAAAAAAAPADLPAGLSSRCGEQGDISLYGKGAPVTVVTADHPDLDLRLTLGDGETCVNCKVEVKAGQGGDREDVAMAAAGGYQQGSFRREISALPAPGDGKLEHLASDSIIATYVNPDNPLDVIRKAFPYRDVSTRVSLAPHNEYARAGGSETSDPARQFVMVAPDGFSPATDVARNWSVVPEAAGRDSLRYVGYLIEASRAFRAEMSIFTNFGEFVNKITFTVPQTEFLKLSKGTKNGTRQLRVLWDNRAANGRAAGTGAYVMKTAVTLLRVPGVAEDEAESKGFRRIGVLRER